MGRKILIIVLILGLFSAILNFRVYAYDDGDFQVWHTEVQEIKISKDFKTVLEEEFRFGDNANDFYYHHYDLGFVYGLNRSLSVDVGYRHIYEKKRGKFRLENEPYLICAYKWEWKGFKLDSRSRLEYRHFDYQTDSWRYRNKFSVKLPWKLAQLEIQPYLADEIFLTFYGTAFNQNRFYSGLGINLTKNLKAEIYYLLQSNKSAHKWTAINALGTKVKLAF